MKRKLFLFSLLCLFVAGINAAELNIYASGLRVNNVDAKTNAVTIDYFLNAPATALEFQLLNAGAVVKRVAITGEDYLTKGAHSGVALDLSSVVGGTYKWALKATAEANATLTKISGIGSDFILYAPKGVAVNFYPETNDFGTVYVSQPSDGASDGGSTTSKSQKKGIFVWNPILELQNTGNAGYTGGITNWASGSPFRIVVAEDGKVFVDGYNDDVHGVWMIDGKCEGNFEKVLTNTGKCYGFDVTPSTNGYSFYTMEDIVYSSSGYVKKYVDVAIPYSGAGTVHTDIKGKYANAWHSLALDGRGGMFLSQYRGADATDLPILAHINSSGSFDWYSASSSPSLSLSNSYRGAMGMNKDKTLLGIASNYTIKVFNVEWDNGLPVLTLAYTVSSLSKNIDGIAFDFADNLYSVNSSSELLQVWAPVKTNNSCTTPAASSRTITLTTLVPVVNVTGVELDETSKTVQVGGTFSLTPTISPADATVKTYTWSTTNSSVATVSNGTVTAVGVGSADITVTTTDGEFTATCAVTVEPKDPLAGTKNIGGASADFASLYEACKYIDDWGISGNVDLVICADLTETKNIGLTNSTNYSITIRPDGTTKRTITFNNIADNEGPSGNIMIGCTMATLVNTDATAQWLSSEAKNIFIDGSYNGDNGQHLEIKGGNEGGVIVVFYGNVTNSEVRNCRLISTRTTNTAYVAHFRTQKSSDIRPVGVGFDNCYMQATGAGNTQVVYYNGSQSSTDAGKPKDCYLRNCEIVSKLRGVFFNGADGAIFEGNTFRFTAASNGYIAHGIMGSVQSGTIIVKGNKFVEMKTTNVAAANGLRAVTASGGATCWIIDNNYFAGLDATAAGVSDKSVELSYIYCGDSCIIRHNTFYLPLLSNKPATALVATQSISCVNLAGSKKCPVEHNIFVSAETTANNSLIRGSAPHVVGYSKLFGYVSQVLVIAHDAGDVAVKLSSLPARQQVIETMAHL